MSILSIMEERIPKKDRPGRDGRLSLKGLNDLTPSEKLELVTALANSVKDIGSALQPHLLVYVKGRFLYANEVAEELGMDQVVVTTERIHSNVPKRFNISPRFNIPTAQIVRKWVELGLKAKDPEKVMTPPNVAIFENLVNAGGASMLAEDLERLGTQVVQVTCAFEVSGGDRKNLWKPRKGMNGRGIRVQSLIRCTGKELTEGKLTVGRTARLAMRQNNLDRMPA